MCVSLRNTFVVNISGLSVEYRFIRPLQRAVHLCGSLLLLLPGWNFTRVFQSCIMSNAASKGHSMSDCSAPFSDISGEYFFLFPFPLHETQKSSVFCLSTSKMLKLLSTFRFLGTLESSGVSHPSLCWRDEYDFVGLCSDEGSLGSTAEPVVSGTVDPAVPTLAEIAVAIERSLPCGVAVLTSQTAFGDADCHVALGEVALFGMQVVLFFWLPVHLCGLCPTQWGDLLVLVWLDRNQHLLCPSPERVLRWIPWMSKYGQ